MGPNISYSLTEALAHHAAGRWAEAERLYRQVLAQNSGHPDALHLSGVLAHQVGRSDRALSLIGRAVAANPSVSHYHSNLGTVLAALGRLDEAVGSYRRALALDPGHVDANTSLAGLLARRGAYGEAGRHYLAALDLAPDHAEALGHGGLMLAQACAWDALGALLPRIEAAARRGSPVPPFSMAVLSDDPSAQLAAAGAASAGVEAAMAPARAALAFGHPPGPRQRLRIGYLSNDYRDHATPWLMAELFELHDRSAFEVLAFSYCPSDGGAMRRRLEEGADRFIDINALDPVAAARRIHGERVDILVDLKGWTADARPHILALRPAPVQVGYLGFPGSMGAGFVDWMLADSVVVPPGAEPFYSERVIRLPGCYQLNDRRRPRPDAPRPRRDYGLPEGAFVFACFNNTFKLTRAVFAQWVRLLAGVEGSVLWLLDPEAEARDALGREAKAAGIDPGRLVFAPRLPFAAHMARHGAADLFLDTFPCTAHTTASDALWAGLPLVTRTGATFASRVAASLLQAVGLPELAVQSAACYEALALALAGDPGRLAALRAHLQAGRDAACLWDSPALVRAIEEAYRRMWQEARVR